ncbi:unnamed protein product [Amoebophrya sp. A25]|nr:unnamed protein product [Amoebophrya sp. A25]|eukprot:GSA25T00016385001.1
MNLIKKNDDIYFMLFEREMIKGHLFFHLPLAEEMSGHIFFSKFYKARPALIRREHEDNKTHFRGDISSAQLFFPRARSCCAN